MRVEAALVRGLHERAVPAPEVEQPPPAAVVEQRREGVEHQLVAAAARLGVVAGEELVVALGVEVAEPVRADPRMAVQEPAARAADDVVVAPPPARVEQRLHARLAAQRAADDLLDALVAALQPRHRRGVLLAGHHRRAPDPPRPAQLVERRRRRPVVQVRACGDAQLQRDAPTSRIARQCASYATRGAASATPSRPRRLTSSTRRRRRARAARRSVSAPSSAMATPIDTVIPRRSRACACSCQASSWAAPRSSVSSSSANSSPPTR